MKKPNIIIVLIDAARPDHFSCYGHERITTPNIDRIASEGIVFENAISTAGWTLPSHTSLFTGTYVSKHGVHNENQVFKGTLPTMPAALKSAGYKTAGFCRNYWISDATGLTNGFSEFYDIHYTGFQRKIRRFINNIRLNGRDSWTFEINRAVCKWLRQNASGDPFFMFVHYSQLHLPYSIPAPFNTMFLPDDVSYEQASRVNQNPKAFYAGEVAMGPEEFEISRALYDCSLAYMDHRVKDLYDELKTDGILDDTLFIITSDHGESLGDHGHFDHYYVLYDSLIKVPLIIRYPDKIDPGMRNDSIVQTLDIFPTVGKMLELPDESLREIQGLPLPPFSDETKHRTFSISERYQDLVGLRNSYPDRDLGHLAKFEKDRKIAIRTKKHKLILSQNYESELFDLEKDPEENHNIIESNAHIAADLESKISEWRASFTAAKIDGNEANFDETVRKRLEALGYLG